MVNLRSRDRFAAPLIRGDASNASGGFGFTLIELLVALTIIALLLSLVVPRYFTSLSRADEAVLKENLFLMRDAIDKHFADTGKYPASLDELASKKYLRTIPSDPLTQSQVSWIVVPPSDPQLGSVYDIKSGAKGNDRTGKPYEQW
jgi:general secretion pathway protein G